MNLIDLEEIISFTLLFFHADAHSIERRHMICCTQSLIDFTIYWSNWNKLRKVNGKKRQKVDEKTERHKAQVSRKYLLNTVYWVGGKHRTNERMNDTIGISYNGEIVVPFSKSISHDPSQAKPSRAEPSDCINSTVISSTLAMAMSMALSLCPLFINVFGSRCFWCQFTER